MKKPDNRMQQSQDAGGVCEFVILGNKDLQAILDQSVTLTGRWAEWCGASEVSMLTYLEKEAEVNGHSLERSIVHAFLQLDYQLTELEVDIVGYEDSDTWGRSVWYAEHPAYHQPVPKLYEESPADNPAFYYAMFKTEHAGDQQFCLYSTQMMMSRYPLMHKTLRYRKVVFSPPPSANDSSA